MNTGLGRNHNFNGFYNMNTEGFSVLYSEDAGKTWKMEVGANNFPTSESINKYMVGKEFRHWVALKGVWIKQ